MRIAFFTDVLFPPLGGIEQHVLDTSGALAKRGHEVRVYYPGQSLNKSEITACADKRNPKRETNHKSQSTKSIIGSWTSPSIPSDSGQSRGQDDEREDLLNHPPVILVSEAHPESVSPACNALRNNADRDFDIRYSNLRPQAGVPISFLWPNLKLAFPLNLYFEFKKWRPDVIHFHTSGPMAWAAIFLSRLLDYSSSDRRESRSSKGSSRQARTVRKPLLVGTFHSYLMEPEYLGNFGSARWRIGDFWVGIISRFLWWYVKSVFNRCDVVVSPSQWVAEDIREHGIKKPVVVIHNGADLSRFGEGVSNEVTKKLRSDFQLSENTLLYVGRLSREKNLDILLRAIQLLNSGPSFRHPEVYEPKDLPPGEDSSGRTPQNDVGDGCKLLLVGDGPMEGELRKLCSDLVISDKVVFLGRIDHKDLPGSGVFEVSRAFVTASTSENQPLTILEAMAKGLPIIGVSARGVTELIKENGLLAAPNDFTDLANKIHQLLSDESARLKMGEESRKMSQDYSLTKAAENLERLYNDGPSSPMDFRGNDATGSIVK